MRVLLSDISRDPHTCTRYVCDHCPETEMSIRKSKSLQRIPMVVEFIYVEITK